MLFRSTGGGWNLGSPQGRLIRPPGWGGSGLPPQEVGQTGSAYSGNYSASMINRNVPADPFNFTFRQPARGLDLGAGANYSLGNAYNSAQIPNNFGMNFAIPTSQAPYIASPHNFGHAGPQGLAPVQRGVVYPGFSGGTPPQIQRFGSLQPPQVNGLIAPAQRIPAQTEQVNPIASPAHAQQRQENMDAAEQNVGRDQKTFLDSAMAPKSSEFDHAKLSELEGLLNEAYENLLQSIQTGDQEARQKWFDEYQSYQREIQALSK